MQDAIKSVNNLLYFILNKRMLFKFPHLNLKRIIRFKDRHHLSVILDS